MLTVSLITVSKTTSSDTGVLKVAFGPYTEIGAYTGKFQKYDLGAPDILGFSSIILNRAHQDLSGVKL